MQVSLSAFKDDREDFGLNGVYWCQLYFFLKELEVDLSCCPDGGTDGDVVDETVAREWGTAILVALNKKDFIGMRPPNETHFFWQFTVDPSAERLRDHIRAWWLIRMFAEFCIASWGFTIETDYCQYVEDDEDDSPILPEVLAQWKGDMDAALVLPPPQTPPVDRPDNPF